MPAETENDIAQDDEVREITLEDARLHPPPPDDEPELMTMEQGRKLTIASISWIDALVVHEGFSISMTMTPERQKLEDAWKLVKGRLDHFTRPLVIDRSDPMRRY